MAEEIDLTRTRELLSEIEKSIQDGKLYPPSLAQGLAAEIAIAEAENADAEPGGTLNDDPLFRLKPAGWAVAELDFEMLVPIVFQCFRVLHFPYDLSGLRGARTIAELPETAAPRRSHIIVFNRKLRRDPLIVDDTTARFLEEIDGRKTVADILNTIDPVTGSLTISVLGSRTYCSWGSSALWKKEARSVFDRRSSERMMQDTPSAPL